MGIRRWKIRLFTIIRKNFSKSKTWNEFSIELIVLIFAVFLQLINADLFNKHNRLSRESIFKTSNIHHKALRYRHCQRKIDFELTPLPNNCLNRDITAKFLNTFLNSIHSNSTTGNICYLLCCRESWSKN